ncbi:MAG: thiamine-phosphate kinase [Candidatus Omnitrophica bacterium]|nr:thiamine-phosphate kinase [Candidatus Omnitrophota bacterium]MDD5238242.1 thiamine-phosphate kinase [Candidatus Omnitrophota bacterium]
MLISKIGEFGLIERFRKSIKTDSSVVVGSGDDCAVIKFSKDKYQLFTCDMLVEGVDFTLRDKPELIGRKALAVSISDIAACAGEPTHCLISLGLPKSLPLRLLDRITRGIFSEAGKYRINILGGDLSRADKLVIDVSMLGMVKKKGLVLRNGAKTGDFIFVTGSLGGSIRGKHLSFAPRLKEAKFLVNNFKVNSMIDISDGLAADLGHILKASNAAAVIYEDLIPLSKDAKNLSEALFMGEDFELLFTLSRSDARKLLNKKDSRFRCIGQITAKKYGIRLIDKNGRERNLKPRGFTHF